MLTDKLDSFLQESPKRFLYLAGTYKSGITASVIKYFAKKNDGREVQIYDFYGKTLKEIKESRILKFGTSKGEVCSNTYWASDIPI